MRTQRNLVRTQRGMVYKYKCALNESALNEVRTQRGFAVLSFCSSAPIFGPLFSWVSLSICSNLLDRKERVSTAYGSITLLRNAQLLLNRLYPLMVMQCIQCIIAEYTWQTSHG